MADVVTVACKIPNGLRLQLCEKRKVDEPVLGGGVRITEQAFPTGEMIHINGPATPIGVAPKCEIVGGYALTHNVPADFWEAWINANARHPAVEERLVFAFEKVSEARAHAEENKDVRSNLEPLDMTMVSDGSGGKRARDPRLPKSRLLRIETADEQATKG